MAGTRRTKGTPGAAALALLLAGAGVDAAHAQVVEEPLVLRVSDTEAVPGGEVAVVVRTYRPRGVGQGQVCIRVRRPAPARTFAAAAAADRPLVELTRVAVFSRAGDATVAPSWDAATQTMDVGFASPTGSVNELDGPLMVLYFTLASDLVPGDQFELVLDPSPLESWLKDAAGNPIEIAAPKTGTLTVRAAGDPQALTIDGLRLVPGEVAIVGVETVALFDVLGGDVEVTFDPAIAATPPRVRMDPRYGSATFTADLTVPGRVQVAFSPISGPLNVVPGPFLEISFLTTGSVPGPGWPVTLATASLAGATGAWPLALESGQIDVDPDGIFVADFETSSAASWLVGP